MQTWSTPSSGVVQGRGLGEGPGRALTGTHTGVFLIQVPIVFIQDIVRVADLFPDVHGLNRGGTARIIHHGRALVPQASSVPYYVGKGVTDMFPHQLAEPDT